MQAGLEASQRRRVTTDDTATALGSGDLAVLATPRLVAWLEGVAVAAVRGALDPGSTTVGSKIDLDHLAPSGLGATITVSARLTAVAGRRLDFEVEAVQDDIVVARGSHVRYVIDAARFMERVASSAG